MGKRTLSRRALLAGGARLTAGSAIAALLRPSLCAAQSSVPATGTHLVLLGTQGGPNFNAGRNETASAVVVDGRVYVVDLGEGGLAAFGQVGLNYRDVARVFLTHLHDDHHADLPSLLSHQWTDGRTAPLVVAGPYGTADLVAAALDYGQANATIRLVDETRSIKPADIFRGQDLPATDEPAEVHRDELVRVTAVENTHFPEEATRQFPYRSLSYRFDTPGRSIVFSGDTAYSTNLVRLARGADVLVCEAIEVAATRRAFERRVAAGAYADNPEGIWSHIVATHTPTTDAGRMAHEASVRMLVLTHVLPGALQPLDDEAYLRGIREHFDGRAVVGKDLMVL
jgi:ribonuclease BN (tRNA processing enzyme)